MIRIRGRKILKNEMINAIVIYVIIIAFLALIRYQGYGSGLIGGEPYYHGSMAETINEQGWTDQDMLTIEARPYLMNPYPVLLAGLSTILSIDILLMVLPWISGLVLIILINIFLKDLKLNNQKRFYSLILVIISPIFLNISLAANPDAFAAIILISSILIITRLQKKLWPLGAVLMMIMPFFGFMHAAAAAIMTIAAALYYKDRKKELLKSLGLMLVTSFLLFSQFYIQSGIPEYGTLNIFSENFSDLGADYGYSIFIFLLAAIGGYAVWRNKKEYLRIYTLFLGSIVISLFSESFKIYSNIIISVLAAAALIWLLEMKWELKQVKIFSIFVIICGILFSSLSYANTMIEHKPANEVMEGLEWFSTQPEGNVLAPADYGYWIEYTAEKRPILDEQKEYIKNIDEKNEDIADLFYSREIEKTKNLLFKYSISYILIDKNMRSGDVWSRKEQGLLFLLRDEETFAQIYNKKGVEIWKVNTKKENDTTN